MPDGHILTSLQLRLDGTVEVSLPDRCTALVAIERLTKLIDGIEQLEDMWGDGLSNGHVDDGTHNDQGDIIEIQEDDGQWHMYNGEDGDDWVEDDDSSMDVDEDQTVSSNVTGEGEATTDSAKQPIPEQMKPTLSSHSEEVIDQDSDWKRFDILPSAPVDHAYYTTTPSQPSRAFLTRLQKEYRALSSSLPGNPFNHVPYSPSDTRVDSIIVRAYEDRSDLLRCLIIGPENTPYEDAPFVIDWMLDSEFPQSPPLAHFLSWTNGNGRGVSTSLNCFISSSD